MVIAVSFRNDTESRFLRHYIQGECINLEQTHPNIARIHIAIYQENCRKPLVTCHLCSHFNNHKTLHLYQHCFSGEQAFEKVLQQFIENSQQDHDEASLNATARKEVVCHG